MQVEVRVFAGLERYIPGASFGEPIYVILSSGATGGELLIKLNIPEEQVFSFLINGVQKKLDDAMAEGDRISVFPPVGGG